MHVGAKKGEVYLYEVQPSILLSIDDTSIEICKILGMKNVISIWYYKQDGVKHNGSANVECLNLFVYKKFIDKEVKVSVYYVKINP